MLVCFSLSSPLLCCFLRREGGREAPSSTPTFVPPSVLLASVVVLVLLPSAPWPRSREMRGGGGGARGRAARQGGRPRCAEPSEKRGRGRGRGRKDPFHPFRSIPSTFSSSPSFFCPPDRRSVRPSVRPRGRETRPGSEASKAPPPSPSPYHSLAQWPFMEATPLQGEKRTDRVYVFPPKLSSSPSSTSIFSSILVFLPSSDPRAGGAAVAVATLFWMGPFPRVLERERRRGRGAPSRSK